MSEIGETEREHPHGLALDRIGSRALIELIAADQHAAVDAVVAAAATLARVADAIAERLERGGRLRYVGAGSSGRIAALDAAELPPTFGVAPALVQAVMAGGARAFAEAVEGAEDDAGAGARAVDDLGPGDAAVALSASGGAAFAVAALARARERGALTVAIANVADAPLYAVAEIVVRLPTGPEVLAGSTRLKAGTAQKIALNALSTAIMARCGKVYDRLMVDVVASNRKLRARALRLVCRLTGTSEPEATELLARAQGSVKVAVVMQRCTLDAAGARARLAACGGRLRAAIDA